MAAISDQEISPPANFDPAIQSENIAFDRDEMVACSRCLRNNPPNRLNCLYCANGLDLPTEKTATTELKLRKLESWERGVNIILRNADPVADIKGAASLMSIELESLAAIVGTQCELPIARVENLQTADTLITQLQSLGFTCFSVTDELLAIEKPNIRISGIEIGPGEFGAKDFNTGQFTRFATYKIALIVEGVISKTKVDTIEKRRLRGESKLIDQSSVAADARILDIYPADQIIGFRLMPTGFDFSCLGDQKTLLARENWGRLIDFLRSKLPTAKYVGNYATVRTALETIWPTESRNETKGLIQTGFGKREFGSVATTSNLEQFNRYSRLQRQLL